eukprot:3511700-Pleurochrysis_carterae.AAC.1
MRAHMRGRISTQECALREGGALRVEAALWHAQRRAPMRTRAHENMRAHARARARAATPRWLRLAAALPLPFCACAWL